MKTVANPTITLDSWRHRYNAKKQYIQVVVEDRAVCIKLDEDEKKTKVVIDFPSMHDFLDPEYFVKSDMKMIHTDKHNVND